MLQQSQKLAAKIDEFIDAGCRAKGVKPATLADDSEFVRRVYLDLTGRIPTVREARDFLEGQAPDKRQRLVEILLDSSNYVAHFTNVWRTQLLAQANASEARLFVPDFEEWLTRRVRDNVPWDQMAREIIAPDFTEPVTPIAFYVAGEFKPDQLAGAASRVFLGINLECAQCHDHPFAKWTRRQFWEFAAFFSGVEEHVSPMSGKRESGSMFAAAKGVPDRHSLKISGTGDEVLARFLNGPEPPWHPGMEVRASLADWMTAADNPFFARNAANRLWAQLFGVGLVHPIDEIGDQNPPSHPELLTELAQQLATAHYDIKFLIRAITASKTYQRSSKRPGPSTEEDSRLFASMPLKTLRPEQMVDSIAVVIGHAPFIDPDLKAKFSARLSDLDGKATDVHTSIQHALTLMNSELTQDVTNLERHAALSAIASAPFQDTAQRIETLYLATLSRKPSADEQAFLAEFVSHGSPKRDVQAALADILWGLLNSAEFVLNH
jgi:hypothetical protein